MCLSRPVPSVNGDESATGYGYKVFRQNENYPNPVLTAIFFHTIFPINKWVKNDYKAWLKCEASADEYLAGFHLFTSEQDAERYMTILRMPDDKIADYKIIRVQYHKILSRGYQLWGAARLECLVVDELRVLP